MNQMLTYPLKNVIRGAVRPGRLRWVGPWLSRLSPGLPDPWRAMRPRKSRWMWGLLLAVAIVLVMGELGPAASGIWPLP